MIIGLTGGIASGKTTVSDELARLGARIVDCDVIVHYLSSYDPTVLTAIRATFGPAVFTSEGSLDRAALSQAVFSDTAPRVKLEAILHPPVIAAVAQNIVAARQAGQNLVVVVPLLYEGGYQELFDQVWVVAVRPEVQIERLLGRGGLSRERAEQMLAAQQPLKEKELLADRVLDNNNGLPELHRQVRELWEDCSGDHAD